jgi:uncharacterized protein
MSLDVTPLVPAGRQLIQGYGGGQFRIAGLAYIGSVLVFRERTLAWPVTEVSAITPESLEAAIAARADVEILLVGCGVRFVAPPRGLRTSLKAHGLTLEWMDTGAACRTFNVLLAEDRRVAAALIAVA